MSRTQRPFFFLLLCVSLPIAGALWLEPGGSAVPPERVVVPAAGPAIESPAPEYSVERFFIGQGGTLAAACARAGLDEDARRQVLRAADRHLDLRRLSPRSGVAVSRDTSGRPVSFSIRSSPDRFLRITLPDARNGLRAEVLPVRIQKRVETTGGVVASSVAQALGHTAHSHTLTQAYADIFQWDVDLLVDPRPGDEVKLVYEVETLTAVADDLPRFGDSASQPGDFYGLGRILAATYRGAIAEASAFWVDDGASWGNYYDADGRPLRKSFLRSPLNYRRISSGFSSARRNPVTRKVVPHHGVDFAAAPGTPITSTADGRVISAGWDGALGKAVRIRHGSEYVTVYGHMRGFARGIEKGVEVRQGQVIGYVGSTGRATGPHLHYVVLKHGRPINPMKLKNPSVDPLDESMRPRLVESRRRFTPVLESILAERRVEVAAKPSGTTETTVLSGS